MVIVVTVGEHVVLEKSVLCCRQAPSICSWSMLELFAANGNTSAMCMMMRRYDVFLEIVFDTTYHVDDENE
jgi:hypothetical protein